MVVTKCIAIERRERIMSQNTHSDSEPNNRHLLTREIFAGILSGLFVLVIGGVGTKIFAIPSQLAELDKRIYALEVAFRVNQAPTSSDANQSGEDDSDKNNQPSQYGTMMLSHLKYSSQIENGTSSLCIEITGDSYRDVPPTLIENPVAYDPDTNKEYTVDDLAGQKICFNYTSDDGQVFFCGQFNEDGYWDGNCIVNIYKDGKLSLITDAQYQNGSIMDFKQVFPYTPSSDIGVWVISDRTMKKGYSSGKTWYYICNGENYDQHFETTSFSEADIISANKFKEDMYATNLDGYYCGNISSGKFNDTTGKAYMVKYFEDGTVRSFYHGNFKDGWPHDATGDAWLIGKKTSTQKEYAFYQGVFNKGVSSKESEYWIDPVSEDWIQSFLLEESQKLGTEFDDCNLKWSLSE